jgi:chemotaxis protein MotA
MDLSTLVGFAAGAAVIGFGLHQGNLLGIFLNAHGLVLVLGGTFAAICVNTPGAQLLAAAKALVMLFIPPASPDNGELTAEMLRLSEGMAREGVNSLRSHMAVKGDGFLTFAVRAAQEKNDVEHVRKVLEDAIRQKEASLNRAASVFQTMGALSPMFGLLGTLIGIVGVLRDIANPSAIGPAMAVALTTAFYGILVSALFCTPIAGKIRARAQEERRMRELVMTGMLDILGGAIPLELRRHLEAFSQK